MYLCMHAIKTMQVFPVPDIWEYKIVTEQNPHLLAVWSHIVYSSYRITEFWMMLGISHLELDRVST